MPMYNISHSYPLTLAQKTALAERITHLHATTFTVPSIYIHCIFTACDASDSNYFVAGHAKTETINRIQAYVRNSSKRHKADFDRLGEQIEDAWYEAILGEKITDEKSNDKGKRKGEVEKDLTASQRDAMTLLAIAFLPIIATREIGLALPEAGEEAKWLKDNHDYFEHLADAKGDQDVAGMLQELNEREDLKKLLA